MKDTELKYLFGKPYEGAHKYRIPIINLALVDVLATVLASYLIARFTNGGKDIVNRTIKIFIILFIIGEIAHYAVGLDTQFIKYVKSILNV